MKNNMDSIIMEMIVTQRLSNSITEKQVLVRTVRSTYDLRSTEHGGAWALDMVLIRPAFFLHFQPLKK